MYIKSLLAASAIAAGAAFLPGYARADQADTAKINAERFAELVATVFNQGKIESADQYFLPSFVDHAPWPGHSADVAGFKAGLAEFRQSFPDLRVRIERTVAQADLLVVHMKMSGSQRSEFMGAPASGKTFEIEAIDIVRMSDGRIAEHWGVIDTGTMAAQLGL